MATLGIKTMLLPMKLVGLETEDDKLLPVIQLRQESGTRFYISSFSKHLNGRQKRVPAYSGLETRFVTG